MQVLWNYLKGKKGLVILSLVLAAGAQLMNLIDPVIFGKIIDDYALNEGEISRDDRVRGVLFWLGVAVAVALGARVAKAFQEYYTRKAVQQFGMEIFNDGLKQTLRLSFQEFEEQRSGETLSILQKVKSDTEKFVNTFINVLYSSAIG